MNIKFYENSIKEISLELEALDTDVNYLRAQAENENLKDISLDLDSVSEHINEARKYLFYVKDDIKEISKDDLDESKNKRKKKKDYTINPDAGNVEYNINMFNHMNGSGTDPGFIPGVGMSESKETNTNEKGKDVYMHEGPVTRFGEPFVSYDKTYVKAISPEEALNRASYIIKKKYRLDPKHSKVELNPDNIKLIKDNRNKRIENKMDKEFNSKEDKGYIDNPSYNDEESERDFSEYDKWLDSNISSVLSKYKKNVNPEEKSFEEYAYELFLKTK